MKIALVVLALILGLVWIGIGYALKRSSGPLERDVRAVVPQFVEKQVAPEVLGRRAEILWREPAEPRPVWTEFRGTVAGSDIRVTATVSHDAPREQGPGPRWWYLDRVTFAIPQTAEWPADRALTPAELRRLGLSDDLVARLHSVARSSPIELVARGENAGYSVRTNVPLGESGGMGAYATVVTVSGANRVGWPQSGA